MYTEYNFSKDIDYHTQRNNVLVPLRSCNTTSAIMAMKQAGITYEVLPDMQDEDYLTMILETDEAYELQANSYAWSVGAYRPQEVHGILQWGINQLAGKTVDRFKTNTSIEEIIFFLIKGHGIMLSGTFDLPNGKELHHIVSLAGFKSSQPGVTASETSSSIDVSSISDMIIDDPYGDFRTGYSNFHGNNVSLSISEFNSIFKKQGDLHSKWAHMITNT